MTDSPCFSGRSAPISAENDLLGCADNVVEICRGGCILQPALQKVAFKYSCYVGQKNLMYPRRVGRGEQDKKKVDVLSRDRCGKRGLHARYNDHGAHKAR